MLLTLTLTGLLSLMGVWLMLQTKNAFRVTTATTRYESVFNLAEAALQLGLRCIRMNSPFPTYAHLTTSAPAAITTGLPEYLTETQLETGLAIPEIYYTGFSKTPPRGWMLNWQGYSAFHNVNYMCRGEGRVELPSSAGDASTAVVSFATRVTQ